MKRIKVHPPKDYFIAFLNTRGIPIVSEDPEVLHYFGSSYRELKKLVKEDAPDLTVIHHPDAMNGRKELDFIFVYDYITHEKDIYRKKQQFKEQLENYFHRKIDIAREKYLSPLAKKTILDDVIYV